MAAKIHGSTKCLGTGEVMIANIWVVKFDRVRRSCGADAAQIHSVCMFSAWYRGVALIGHLLRRSKRKPGFAHHTGARFHLRFPKSSIHRSARNLQTLSLDRSAVFPLLLQCELFLSFIDQKWASSANTTFCRYTAQPPHVQVPTFAQEA